MGKLVNTMIHKGFLKSDNVIDAFAEVPRVEFMPKKFRSASEADIPIPLGYGHMMPAPSIVAYMLELLDPQKGQKILVAGLGSGWISALLCYIVGANGHVSSCDTSESIERDAQENIAKFSFIERDHIIDIYTVKSCDDIIRTSQFDRIIVFDPYFTSCDLESLLSIEGVLVMPRDNVIHCHRKKSSGEVDVDVYNGMIFLPEG